MNAVGLEQKIAEWNAENNLEVLATCRASSSHAAPAPATGRNEGRGPPRTLARPQFSGADAPLNTCLQWAPSTVMKLGEFDVDKVSLGICFSSVESVSLVQNYFGGCWKLLLWNHNKLY